MTFLRRQPSPLPLPEDAPEPLGYVVLRTCRRDKHISLLHASLSDREDAEAEAMQAQESVITGYDYRVCAVVDFP